MSPDTGMETNSLGKRPGASPFKAFLTISEAAEILGISRNSAYLAAKQYRQSQGREGLPNIRISGVFRVPASALERMADIAVPDSQVG